MRGHPLTEVNHHLEELQEKRIRLTNIKTSPGIYTIVPNEEMIKLITSTIVVAAGPSRRNAQAGLGAEHGRFYCKEAPDVSSDELGVSADWACESESTMQVLEDAVRYSMTRHTGVVTPEMTIGDLLRLFAVDQQDAYPVVSSETLVGIVSMSDALKAFASDEGSQHYDEVIGTKVGEVMTRHVMTVQPGTKLRHALQLMGAYRFKNLPVVDDKNRLLGMISREDIARVLTQRGQSDARPLAAPAVGYYTIA